jgi:hypothetical protein
VELDGTGEESLAVSGREALKLEGWEEVGGVAVGEVPGTSQGAEGFVFG